MLSPEFALSVVCRASCAALAIGFLEQLMVFDRIFGPRGPFSVSVTNVIGAATSPGVLLGAGLRYVLLVGAVSSGLGAALGPYSLFGRYMVVTALVCVVLSRLRRVMASDGAEQMAILALFATCVAVLPGLNHSATTLAVWFVGCQSLLSYATAGVAKVVSPTWRGGLALPLIMGSEAHGQPWASAILEAHPSLAVLSTRLVVLFECSFPFVVIAPKGVVIGILAAGVALHLGIAVAMGLNAFLLVFPASYGCVAYIAQQVSPFW